MVTRWAAPAVALLLGVLLVAGGATALATRATGRSGAGSAPPPVPTQGAGSSEVQLSAAAANHRGAERVRAQLQRHYDSINEGDYAAWRGTVVEARSNAMPEDEWQDAYGSTRDGTIRLDRIDAAPGQDTGVLVRVRFVSSQDLDDAPADLRAPRICWRSTLPMRGVPPRIDVTGGGSSAREAC
jgi:hypothetical protein